MHTGELLHNSSKQKHKAPKLTSLPTRCISIETSSKVAAGPLASGDPQVTLSHVECLTQALALDPVGPLVTLRISLN